jgi:hypothetical protein
MRDLGSDQKSCSIRSTKDGVSGSSVWLCGTGGWLSLAEDGYSKYMYGNWPHPS